MFHNKTLGIQKIKYSTLNGYELEEIILIASKKKTNMFFSVFTVNLLKSKIPEDFIDTDFVFRVLLYNY